MPNFRISISRDLLCTTHYPLLQGSSSRMGERCVNNLTPGNLPVWPPASSFLFPPIQVSFLFLPKSSNTNESTENVIFSLSNYSLPCLMLQLTNTVDSLRGGSRVVLVLRTTPSGDPSTASYKICVGL